MSSRYGSARGPRPPRQSSSTVEHRRLLGGGDVLLVVQAHFAAGEHAVGPGRRAEPGSVTWPR